MNPEICIMFPIILISLVVPFSYAFIKNLYHDIYETTCIWPNNLAKCKSLAQNEQPEKIHAFLVIFENNTWLLFLFNLYIFFIFVGMDILTIGIPGKHRILAFLVSCLPLWFLVYWPFHTLCKILKMEEDFKIKMPGKVQRHAFIIGSIVINTCAIPVVSLWAYSNCSEYFVFSSLIIDGILLLLWILIPGLLYSPFRALMKFREHLRENINLL